MSEAQDITERILYRLSLDPKARALAERLLGRFRCLVGNLPASADHHHSEPGGLYAHSVEVALGTVEAFEGNIIMERKPDGSVDSFRSARNRPRWQYAAFIAALCHDLGKLFDLELRAEERRWCPLKQTYADFVRVDRKPLSITWRSERQHGAHAALSCFLIHHLLSPEDVDYLGLPRLIHIADTLAGSHSRTQGSPIGHSVKKADQSSVERAHVSLAARPDSKIGQFLEALEELIAGGQLGVNIPGGQVYVYDSAFVNSYSPTANRASSSFDQRHVLNFGYVWDLPFSGKRGLTNVLIGGWQYSGIATLYTGTPISVIFLTDNAGVGNGIGSSSYADIVGNPRAGVVNNASTWVPNFGPEFYNSAAFAPPSALTFGDSGRNSLRNPDRVNFDMALFKHFKASAHSQFEFRAEAFNVFNHTEWLGIPNIFSTTPNGFLHAGGAHQARVIQLALKVLF